MNRAADDRGRARDTHFSTRRRTIVLFGGAESVPQRPKRMNDGSRRPTGGDRRRCRRRLVPDRSIATVLCLCFAGGACAAGPHVDRTLRPLVNPLPAPCGWVTPPAAGRGASALSAGWDEWDDDALPRPDLHPSYVAFPTDSDHDGDRIPDVIERAGCTSAYDADSDRDGIPDDWETLGTVEFAYPAEGADPCHKDIFVEVDYQERPGLGGIIESARPSDSLSRLPKNPTTPRS